MCGIVGEILGPSMVADTNSRSAAVASLRHRGPDGAGQFEAGKVWLGHARLSVIDLSESASQPMVSACSRYVISYNGEVYNFAELASQLGLAGLRSTGDTEVILEAFAREGLKVLSALNGIFAFAIQDRVANKVWLVRDRLGIKPLYYSADVARIVFASEIKALDALGIEARINLDSLAEWAYFGVALGDRTLRAGIFEVPPGHYAEIDLDTLEMSFHEYWSPAAIKVVRPTEGAAALAEKVSALLEAAVRRQLVSDVPVGVFLSGGIDSSAITAFAARNSDSKISTYAASFDFDSNGEDVRRAAKVAEHFQTDHHTVRIQAVDVPSIVERMVSAHDSPFADAANIPLFLLSEKVSSSVKVVLQGDGGDELFGGYRRHAVLSMLTLARASAKIAELVMDGIPGTRSKSGLARYARALDCEDRGVMMALLLTEDGLVNPLSIFHEELQARIDGSAWCREYQLCRKRVETADALNQMLLVDSMIILPRIFLEKVDRATMAASIEVRVPFLDNELFDFVVSLPGSFKVSYGRKKQLLKRALRGLVPDFVLDAPKRGFGVPYGAWLKTTLVPMFFDHLETIERKHAGLLDTAKIRRLHKQHVAGVSEHSFLLWKVLNFMIWVNGSKRLAW